MNMMSLVSRVSLRSPIVMLHSNGLPSQTMAAEAREGWCALTQFFLSKTGWHYKVNGSLLFFFSIIILGLFFHSLLIVNLMWKGNVSGKEMTIWHWLLYDAVCSSVRLRGETERWEPLAITSCQSSAVVRDDVIIWPIVPNHDVIGSIVLKLVTKTCQKLSGAL